MLDYNVVLICFFKWAFKVPILVKPASQYSHLKGFALPWTRRLCPEISPLQKVINHRYTLERLKVRVQRLRFKPKNDHYPGTKFFFANWAGEYLFRFVISWNERVIQASILLQYHQRVWISIYHVFEIQTCLFWWVFVRFCIRLII